VIFAALARESLAFPPNVEGGAALQWHPGSMVRETPQISVAISGDVGDINGTSPALGWRLSGLLSER